MSDSEPIGEPLSEPTRDPECAPLKRFQVAIAKPTAISPPPRNAQAIVAFDRLELNQILNVYGRKVAAGEWRDYAIDMGHETAVFSVFRRASEVPIYRIEKSPKLARKQGAYAVIAASGLIMKRGSDLSRVLQVLDKSMRLVSV